MGILESLSVKNLVAIAWLQADSVGLLSGAITLGWMILTPLFAIRAWRAAAAGRGGDVSSLLVRFIIVGALLTSMGYIQNSLQALWSEAYEWSSHAATQLLTNPSAELQQAMNDLAGGSDYATVLTAVLAFAGGDSAGRDALAATGTLGATVTAGAAASSGMVGVVSRSLLGWFTRAIRFILIPIMLFFLVLLFISALTSLIAAILLPVALPWLLTPVGGGLVAGLLSRTVASYGAVIALPLIFAVAVNLGVLMPLSTFISGFQDAMAAFEGSGTQSQGNVIWSSFSQFWSGLFRGDLSDWSQNITSGVASVQAIGDFFAGIMTLIDALLFGLLMLIVGIIAAVAIVVAINQIFERLLGTIMVAGGKPSINRSGLMTPSPTTRTNTGGGGGGGGGPPQSPASPPIPRGAIASGSTTGGSGQFLNASVPQPSAYMTRQTRPLNTSPDATPDAEV